MTNYNWQPDIIEDFKGINNQTDPYSEEASTTVSNFDIDMGNNLVKTKGYERNAFLNMDIVSISKHATAPVITVADGSSLSTNDIVMFYNFIETGTTTVTFTSILYGNMYKITKTGTNTFTISANTSGVTSSLTSGIIDLSLQLLGDTFFTGSGQGLDVVKNFGSIRKNDTIYAFIGRDDGSYLCSVDLTTNAYQWGYVEASPTKFSQDDTAYFVEYDNKIVFTKNEKKLIGGLYGGTLYLNGTTLALYGQVDNPTGKYIAVHNDRLWVGNISYQANTAQTAAGSWVIVSKLIPEAVDTEYTISGATVGTSTKLTITSHTFVVGDRIFVSGIVGTLGTDLLNGNMWEITALAPGYVILGEVNSTGLAYSSGGKAYLRGNTWGVSIYSNFGYGSGIIKCDNNDTDEVMQLASFKGYLNIFRNKSIYIFTGSIETGDVTLPRALNVPYGAVSSSICVTEGGVFFVSQYGVSQVVGVTVKSVQTQFDNIETLSVSEPIKIDILSRGNYSNLSLFRYDRYLWCYDKEVKYVYQLDLVNSRWNLHTNKQVDNLFKYNDNSYIIADTGIYKLETGYVTYTDIHNTSNIVSTWESSVRVQGLYNILKAYKELYLLGVSKGNPNALQLLVDITYDNSKLKTQSITMSLDINSVETWATITGNATLTWDEITDSGTLTWQEILGIENDDMILKQYGMCTAKSIKIRITHNYPYEFTLNRMIIYYDSLGKQDIK